MSHCHLRKASFVVYLFHVTGLWFGQDEVHDGGHHAEEKARETGSQTGELKFNSCGTVNHLFANCTACAAWSVLLTCVLGSREFGLYPLSTPKHGRKVWVIETNTPPRTLEKFEHTHTHTQAYMRAHACTHTHLPTNTNTKQRELGSPTCSLHQNVTIYLNIGTPEAAQQDSFIMWSVLGLAGLVSECCDETASVIHSFCLSGAAHEIVLRNLSRRYILHVACLLSSHVFISCWLNIPVTYTHTHTHTHTHTQSQSWGPTSSVGSVLGSLYWVMQFCRFDPPRDSGRGELTWVLTPFPQSSLGWEYIQRSCLYTHGFHHTDSKNPDIRVLSGWMPAAKKPKTTKKKNTQKRKEKNPPSMHHSQIWNMTTSVLLTICTWGQCLITWPWKCYVNEELNNHWC